MRWWRRFGVLPLVATAIAGCATVSASFDGGRIVTARSALVSSTRVSRHPDEVVVTLGGKTVHVTEDRATADGDGSVSLPDAWKRMELEQASGGRGIVVRVDGRKLATIHPQE